MFVDDEDFESLLEDPLDESDDFDSLGLLSLFEPELSLDFELSPLVALPLLLPPRCAFLP